VLLETRNYQITKLSQCSFEQKSLKLASFFRRTNSFLAFSTRSRSDAFSRLSIAVGRPINDSRSSGMIILSILSRVFVNRHLDYFLFLFSFFFARSKKFICTSILRDSCLKWHLEIRFSRFSSTGKSLRVT